MTNEQIQALRAAAENFATLEEMYDRAEITIREYISVNDQYHNIVKDPANILSLLAERAADKALIAEQAKSIDFLKEQLAQLANFNPDWDKLEAATDSLREHMAELTEANKRIADTGDALCKLLPGVQYMDPPDGGQVEPIEQVSRMVADYRQQIAEQAKRIVELEISCDRNYVEGMKTGWNYCDAGNSEGFNNCVEQREKDIRDARTTGITLVVGE